MTPLESWVLFGACIAVGAWVYIAMAGGRRYRRIMGDALTFTPGLEVAPRANIPPGVDPPSPVDPTTWVRVPPSVYDWQTREDFHDPIRDHAWCDDCNARLRRAFNRLGDLDLGPRDADVLMAAIRRELDS
jgi:hypothetical protein